MNKTLYYLIQYYEKRNYSKLFKFDLIPKNQNTIKMYELALKYCSCYEMNVKKEETFKRMEQYIVDYGVYELTEFTRLQHNPTKSIR